MIGPQLRITWCDHSTRTGPKAAITNGVTIFGLYGLAFVGGWIERIGSIFGNKAAEQVGIVTSLLMPSEALWQLAAYHMQPVLMAQLGLTPFSSASEPSPWMVLWAVGFIVATLGFARRITF